MSDQESERIVWGTSYDGVDAWELRDAHPSSDEWPCYNTELVITVGRGSSAQIRLEFGDSRGVRALGEACLEAADTIEHRYRRAT
jgi:hypothetical protein